MIKLKTKIIENNEDGQLIELKTYKCKHTTTAEHIMVISVLVNAIMENDDDMSITKLCKLIKSNYEKENEYRV